MIAAPVSLFRNMRGTRGTHLRVRCQQLPQAGQPLRGGRGAQCGKVRVAAGVVLGAGLQQVRHGGQGGAVVSCCFLRLAVRVIRVLLLLLWLLLLLLNLMLGLWLELSLCGLLLLLLVLLPGLVPGHVVQVGEPGVDPEAGYHLQQHERRQ